MAESPLLNLIGIGTLIIAIVGIFQHDWYYIVGGLGITAFISILK